MKIVYAALILGVCVALFIFTYLLNKRTPKPEGCQNLESNCAGCQITSCANHPNKEKENL